MARLGVIGVGAMGKNHARVASEVSELVGVSDLDEKVGKEIAWRFNTGYYKDYKDLLKEDPDGVVVATPTAYHREVALAAIERGINVLVEKPMAMTVDEASEIIKAAEKAGVTLAVGHIERHNPVVKFTYENLRKGTFGEVITIGARRVSNFPARIRDVGVIMDLGVHDIDSIRYLAASEVRKVSAVAGNFKHDKYEDHAVILMEFENGIIGHIDVNWLTPRKVRKVFLTCEKGYAEMDYIKQSLEFSSTRTPEEIDTTDLFNFPIEFQKRDFRIKSQEPLRLELVDFIEAFTKGKHPLVTGDDGMRVLKIALAAIRSYKEGKIIEV